MCVRAKVCIDKCTKVLKFTTSLKWSFLTFIEFPRFLIKLFNQLITLGETRNVETRNAEIVVLVREDKEARYVDRSITIVDHMTILHCAEIRKCRKCRDSKSCKYISVEKEMSSSSILALQEKGNCSPLQDVLFVCDAIDGASWMKLMSLHGKRLKSIREKRNSMFTEGMNQKAAMNFESSPEIRNDFQTMSRKPNSPERVVWKKMQRKQRKKYITVVTVVTIIIYRLNHRQMIRRDGRVEASYGKSVLALMF